MATEVILTGTGFPSPNADRAGPGVLIRHGSVTLQFDSGRATTMRLAACSVACGDLTALFVTHHHSDHIVGIPDLVMSRWIVQHPNRDQPLLIIVPDGEGPRIVEHMLDVWQGELRTRADNSGRTTLPEVRCMPFEATADPSVIWKEGGISVSACLVHHEPLVPAVGYRVDTADGSVVISGDTVVCQEMERLANGADVLVHEAVLSQFRRRFFPDNYHTDTIELGAMAQRAGVPTLMLTHLIPPPTEEAHIAKFERDVRDGGYTGNIVVGHDLCRHVIG